jgi:hypothetical protein
MENMIKLEAPGEIIFRGMCFAYVMLPGFDTGKQGPLLYQCR